ncbi:MAG: metal ABC transporter ATP-binding protein [Candidatus Sumerlaeota bacterium]
MNEKTAAVEFEDVSFAYESMPIIENATFALNENEAVSIVGPNGGGKTTLLRLILGQVQPSRGAVRLFGRPPSQSRSRIGYMPQHIDLDPQFPVTVLDVVLMGRLGKHLFGPYKRKDHEMARQAMDEMDIGHLADAPLADLSGGQRQRVLIARALACDPKILLLDEPTSSVDASVEARLHDTLLELRERMTVIMVSHDLGFVSSLVERVLCVNRNVKIHNAGHIDDEIIEELYGAHQHAVNHDHDYSPNAKEND